MPTNYFKINHKLLAWARARARYSEAALAKKVGISEDKYRKFEKGEASPTLRQFFLLAKFLNRPAQFFYMETPPDEPDILTEFRRLPGSEIGTESPELAHRTSLILNYREMAIRLFEGLGEQIPKIDLVARVGDNPTKVGTQIRNRLGISSDEQAKWYGVDSSSYYAYRMWREALERVGVLVFQIPYVSLREIRGFSIPFETLPIIGVNSKEASVRARIFTIFHELVHVIIGERMLDAPSGQLWYLGSNYPTEFFCNQVAAAILMPEDDLPNQLASLGKSKSSNWSDDEILILSKRYVVSKGVVIRRLRDMGMISNSSYQELVEEYDQYVAPSGGEGGNPYKTALSRVGNLLSNLAFRGYYQNIVSESELSSLFGLQASKLGSMEETTFERVSGG